MALLAAYNHRGWDRVAAGEDTTRLDVQKVS